jgi:hypothetical protein
MYENKIKWESNQLAGVLLRENTTINGTQQDSNQWKILLLGAETYFKQYYSSLADLSYGIIIISISSTVLALTTRARKREAFLLKCWLSSDDGHHLPNHVKALFYY